MFDTHALKAGISLRHLCPLIMPVLKRKTANHTRRNHRRRTPAMLAHQPALAPPHPLKPPHLPPASHHRASRSHSPCAHAQGQSRVRACRTVLEEHAAPAAWGMQTETPPKQAALARQVRQRMNRLGKPEHRARFCFFSKKKSRAGTRRFPIPLKIQIRTGFNRSAAIPTAPKTLLQSPLLAGACANHARRNHRICRPHRITAPLGAAPCALAQGQSRVRACRTVHEGHAAPAA